MERSERVRLFIKEELLLGIDITLSAHQAKYLFKVLRLNIGHFITILDGKTGEYQAKIIGKGIQTGKIRVEQKKLDIIKPPDLWLLFSPLRKNRTEWIIEKATELGVRKIVPVLTSRTIESNIRMVRLESIMIEALEQCGGTFLPVLTEPVTLTNCLKSWPSNRQLIFCDESLSQTAQKNSFGGIYKNKVAAILIGPEGGFSESEGVFIKKIKNVESISLGPRILRADTEAVSAMAIWQNIC